MIIQIIPRKYGKTENYFHFWVDYYLPYLVAKQKYNSVQVYGESSGFWQKIDSTVEFTNDENFIVIKGYNPLYFKWTPDILDCISNFRKKYVTNPNDEKMCQLYIERLSNKRYIKNSENLFQMLQLIFPQIEKINLEHMSLEQQVKKFSNASVVIGQHGAGLTNLMWSPKNTFVVEIDKNVGRLHFANMCSYLGQKHFKYGAVKTPMNTIRQKKKAECFNVNLFEFKEFIESKINEHYISPNI